MRLLIGILAFLIWSAGSGYWYVCKIKGACDAESPLSSRSGPIVAQDTLVPPPLFGSEPDTIDPAEELPDEPLSTDEEIAPSVPETVEEVAKNQPATTGSSSGKLPGNIAGKYTVLFSFARPIIQDRPDLTEYFGKVSNYLQSNPTARIRLVGYTDDTAARENNLKLGMRRAEAVAELLQAKGVAERQIILESKGEENPLGNNNTSEGRQKNRRVEMEIIN